MLGAFQRHFFMHFAMDIKHSISLRSYRLDKGRTCITSYLKYYIYKVKLCFVFNIHLASDIYL